MAELYDQIRGAKPSSRGTLPKKWFCFDSETTNGLYGKALLICVVGNEGTELTFEGEDATEQFKNWIDTHHKKLRNAHFYAHNLEFDLSKVFGQLYQADNLAPLMAGSRLISATYNIRTRKLASGKTKHEVITFRDSMNLIPHTSLGDVGEFLGYPKFETPAKWLGEGMTVDQIDDTDREYCMRDCKVLQKFIERFAGFIKFAGISLKSTAAANAKAMWVRLYLKEQTLYIREELDEEFREAYYGGRTEVFISRIDTTKLYHYDVNSLYPSVMVGNKFPNPTRLHECVDPTIDDLESLIHTEEGMANITITSPKLHIPLLPFRDGKLLFPVGTITGSYCFPEIRYALKLGYKIDAVHQIISSSPMESPFTEYIGRFEEMKIDATVKGDKVMRQLAKLFMNSLYGKFAQQTPDEEQYKKLEDVEESDGAWRLLADLKTVYLMDVESVRSKGTVVCWASYICSYARCRLYDYLNANPKETYYCDTDSIFTSIPLPHEQISETEFGLMNLEGMVDKSVFTDPKKYRVREDGDIKDVIKGLDKEQKNNLTWDNYTEPEIRAEGFKPSKTKESLRRGIAPFSKLRSDKVLIRHGSSKRIFDDNGDSRPMTIA